MIQVGDAELVAKKTARILTFSIIICSAAGALAGWSAFSTQSTGVIRQSADVAPARTIVPLASNKDVTIVPLTSNREAKGDKLVAARMMLASADATMIAAPMVAAAAPAAPVTAAVPLPPVKRKIPTAQPPQVAQAALDESQIAHIKNRLRLTPSQQQYWPAVEAALRDVLRQHAREARRTGAPRSAANIDTNSPEVQRLTWAAMPLLMQLREDQKHEVRKFARTIGLDQVASQI